MKGLPPVYGFQGNCSCGAQLVVLSRQDSLILSTQVANNSAGLVLYNKSRLNITDLQITGKLIKHTVTAVRLKFLSKAHMAERKLSKWLFNKYLVATNFS